MMKIEFSSTAFKDYRRWQEKNPQIAERINLLLKEIIVHPKDGLGKPEPLKWDLSGWWSRRIDREHRLIYKIENEVLYVLSCRYHYW